MRGKSCVNWMESKVASWWPVSWSWGGKRREVVTCEVWKRQEATLLQKQIVLDNGGGRLGARVKSLEPLSSSYIQIRTCFSASISTPNTHRHHEE